MASEKLESDAPKSARAQREVRFRVLDRSWHGVLVELFTSTFSDSAGAAEGAQLQRLVDGLAARIDGTEIICLGALEGDERLVAAIFLTALRFEQRIGAYLLAPVAVATDQQRKGLGQALIRHGLDWLRRRGEELTRTSQTDPARDRHVKCGLVITYGDPAYYGKLGFLPLSEAVIQAPLPLSQPHGWQAMSLSGKPVTPIAARPTCVTEFNDPALW